MKRKILWIGCLLCLLHFASAPAGADDLASSPWVGWRKGYDCYDRAGAFRDGHEYDKALEMYEQSRRYYMAVQTNFPDWNKQVIAGRIKLCDEEIAALRKLSGRPAARPRNIETPPERRSVPDTASSRGAGRAAAPDVAGKSGRLYIEMQSELEQYRQRLRMALEEIDTLQVKLQQAETRGRDVDGLLRDYRLLQDKYTLLEVRYKDALARAAEPGREQARLKDQLLELKARSDEAAARQRELEGELAKSARETALARQEAVRLREDAKKHANELKRMAREVELARIDKAVPAADEETWRKRIEALEKELTAKDQRLNRVMKLLAENSDSAAAPLANELKTMQEELNALRSAAQSEEGLRRRATALTAEIEKLRGQLHRSEGALQTLRNEKTALEAAVQAGRNAAQVAHADLKLVRERTAKLETELKSVTGRYGELEKRYQDRVGADMLRRQELARANTTLTADLAVARAAEQQLRKDLEQCKHAAEEHAARQEESRRTVMELKNRLLSGEIELRKMADLQKAYDELKHRFDLIRQTGNADVLAALNRIPGLEESLRRYEQENTALLKELKTLRENAAAAAARETGRKTPPNAPAPLPGESEKLETLLAEARTAEARGNQEVAIWAYRQVLARRPEHGEAARRLGAVYLARGQFDEAFPLLEKAFRKMPDDPRVLDDLARAGIGRRDYAGALRLLQNFRREHGGRAEGFLLLTEALAWSRSGKADEAEKAFKAVLKLDPGNAEAAYELALMLSAAPERRKEAGEFYLLAKERGVAPDSYLEDVLKAVTGSDRDTLAFLRQNALEALERRDWVSVDWYLAELEKLEAKDPELRRMRQMACILRNRPAAAVELGAQAGLDAADADRILLAAALLENGRREEAEQQLKRLPEQAVYPGAPEVLKKHLVRHDLLKKYFP